MTKKDRIPERGKLALMRPSGESNLVCAACAGPAGSGPAGFLQKLENRSPDFSGNSRSGRQTSQKLEARTRDTFVESGRQISAET